MRRTGKHDLEVDLWWQQTGPGEWVALVTNRKTGQRVEAHSVTELREALENLRDGGSLPAWPAPPESEGANLCAETGQPCTVMPFLLTSGAAPGG